MNVAFQNGFPEHRKHQEIIQKFRKSVAAFTTKAHTDDYLLRYLKASNFDLQKANASFRMNCKLRLLIQADRITKEYEKLEVFDECEFSSFMGFDNDDNPIYYVYCGNADFQGFIQSISMMDISMYGLYTFEYLLELQRNRNKQTGRFREGVTIIIDLERLPFNQIFHRNVLEIMLEQMRVFQIAYPGLLNRVLVINAPFYFSALFKLFKPILMMDIIEKMIVCTKESTAAVLLECIDSAVLPAFLGGERLDENGDPFCSSFLKFGQKVPEEYYSRNRQWLELTDPGVFEVIIPVRGSKDVAIDVDEPRSKCQVEFCSDNSIGLQAFFRKNNNTRNEFITSNNITYGQSSEEEILGPRMLCNSNTVPIDVIFHCEKPGIYIFRLDHSSSWVSPNRVLYRVGIVSSYAGLHTKL